jgi:hypothetical protein
MIARIEASDLVTEEQRVAAPDADRALRVFSSTLDSMNGTAARQMCGSEGLEIAKLAIRYCDLIEASGRGDRRWLAHVAHLLPRLHAAISSVSSPSPSVGYTSRVDLDERFELYSRLRLLLGDRDGYWLEFDRAGDGADGMTGSLADDLTDIYCELKAGLGLYDQSPEDALTAWVCSYEVHWGGHLADAERHLAQLTAHGRLEF